MLFITIQPDGTLTEHNVPEGEPTYPVLRDAVKGIIEPWGYEVGLTHYHNEEYLYAPGEVFEGLNFAPLYFGEAIRVYGPIIYTGGVDDEGETRGLTEDQASALRGVSAHIVKNLEEIRALNAHVLTRPVL